MENRSNYVIVGSVALALVIGIFITIIWLSRFSGADERRFDVFFDQSITGLTVGSPVAFNGVPVGKVEEIRLLPKTPQYVRVRISVGEEVPVLQGTTAAVESIGFTGGIQVQLSGAMQGGNPINKPGPYGVPVIPSRRGALGQLLANAPELLNNISRLAERLGDVLDPANQKSIAGILKNSDRITANIANQGPQLAAAIADLRTTLQAASATLNRIDGLAASTHSLVDSEGKPLLIELRTAVASANTTLKKLDGLADAAKPGVESFSAVTLPEANQLIRELRETTTSLGAIAAKLDEDPAGALVGGRSLPSYTPPKEPKE
jgi:phospholipid/cholesterol/gamma-HCH transport system substrate-binding protein